MNVVYSNFVRSSIQLFFNDMSLFRHNWSNISTAMSEDNFTICKRTTHVTLFLKPSVNFNNWISSISRADICTVHFMFEFPCIISLYYTKNQHDVTLAVFFFIVAPCILITLMFLSPTNAFLYLTYKMLKYTVKISHVCSYMFRSIWTIIREPMPNLTKVTILCIGSLMMVQMDRNM